MAASITMALVVVASVVVASIGSGGISSGGFGCGGISNEYLVNYRRDVYFGLFLGRAVRR